MLSWYNLLSGLGMIAVGAGAMAYWYYRNEKRISPVYFLIGGVLWAVAIAIKLALDLTISASLSSWLTMTFTPLATVAILGLYYGLRTGLFESGMTWLAVRYTKLSGSGFDEAVALGIGFGGTEAILLGVLSLVAVGSLLLMPGVAATLPDSVLEQFSPVMVPVPIVERLFTLFCHVFATVLVVYAARFRDPKWLGLSIVYKTLLDGSLPLFSHALAGMDTLAATGIIEAFVALMGVVGLAGLIWIRQRWLSRAPGGRRTME